MNTQHNPKKKRSYAEKQRRMRQVFAIVMAALMVLGVVASIMPYVGASDGNSDTPALTEPEPAPSEDTEEAPDIGDGPLLRIGLMFGSGVTPSFAQRAPAGFLIHSVDKDSDLDTLCYETDVPYVAVCRDANLALNEDGYFIPATEGVIIGGYHLDLPKVYANAAALAKGVADVNAKLMQAGLHSTLVYAFPAYKNGSLIVRIGDFGSAASAEKRRASVAAAVGEEPKGIYPSDTAVTVLAPDTNLILFEYESKTGQLGLSARPDADGGQNVIMTPAENTYEGIFVYDRYKEGISVTSLLPLEKYVAGVVPYEINNKWGKECLKAFAVSVRSYVLSNRGKHASYGIDLCNGYDCQVYMGTKSQNAAVLEAINETKGMVITYGGKICSTIYSAVMGGSTVNVEQIWNGTAYPYLRAVQTPWEDYASHTYGEWVSQVSGQALYTYLVGKGYTQLKGEIREVSIAEFAENSTYVYRLRLVDAYGNEVILKGTDIVRTTLGRYLKSANFLVAKDGLIPQLEKPLTVITPNGEKEIPTAKENEEAPETMQIMTADGIKTVDVSSGMTVKDADGKENVMGPGIYDIPEEAKEIMADPYNHNFIFVGKGWGHGGGLSQWGAKNLAEQGATWEEILHAYFTDVTIAPYTSILK